MLCCTGVVSFSILVVLVFRVVSCCTRVVSFSAFVVLCCTRVVRVITGVVF